MKYKVGDKVRVRRDLEDKFYAMEGGKGGVSFGRGIYSICRVIEGC